MEGVEDQQLEERRCGLSNVSPLHVDRLVVTLSALSPAKYRRIVDMVHVAQSPPVRRATPVTSM